MTRHPPKTVSRNWGILEGVEGQLLNYLHGGTPPFLTNLNISLLYLQYQTKEGHRGILSSNCRLPHTNPFHSHTTTLIQRSGRKLERQRLSLFLDSSGQRLAIESFPHLITTKENPRQSQASTLSPAAMARPRITVLGSLNIDLVSYVPHHPLPGETLTANHFNTSPGGKGANQAVACGKLSRSSDLSAPAADVSMIGAVGSDTYGQQLISSLTSYGVDTSAVAVREDGKTGIAIIVVDEPSGQNRIILSAEANHTLLPEHFSTLPGPRPDLLIMQLEIPFDTVLKALRTANESGIPVLLNPAPAKTLPDEAYHNLAHLVVNETEAAILSGCKESDLDDLAGLERVGALFIQRGVSNVIITLGGRGVYYATKNGKSALVPALKADVVDTTAAGDTFVGSYALAVVSAESGDFDIDTAIRAANKAAAITVSRKGAQISIAWKDELN